MKPDSQIWISPYELKPALGGKPRRGVLIKVFFPESGLDLDSHLVKFSPTEPFSGCGYADCHPWPELGDPDVDAQVEALRARAPLSLAKFSLEWARIDASYRAKDESINVGSFSLPCHCFLPIPPSGPNGPDLVKRLQLAVNQYLLLAKIKWDPGYDVDVLAEVLSACKKLNVRLRIDGNEKFSLAQMEALLTTLERGPGLENIDWIEDPCPYNDEDCAHLRRRFGVKLGVDFPTEPEIWATGTSMIAKKSDVVILKPNRRGTFPLGTPRSRRDVHPSWQYRTLKTDREGTLRFPKGHASPIEAGPIGDFRMFCITGDLGHPFGAMIPLYLNIQFNSSQWVHQRETSGGASFDVYEPDAFSAQYKMNGPYLIPPGGAGFGFGEQLEALAWIPI